MPRPFAVEPLFVPADARDQALAVLHALSLARLVPLASLRAFAAAEGLEPSVLDTWVSTGLVARTFSVTDPVRASSMEIAALTPAGARAASELTARRFRPVPPARIRRSGQKLAHDAGVGDVALTFLAAGRTGIATVAGVETDDAALATSGVTQEPGAGATRVPLQADAYVALTTPRGPAGLLVEYDRATVSVARMARKYAAYAAWRAADGPLRTFSVKALRVLTVVPDERRLTKLHDAALEAVGRRSGFFLFALASDLTPADPERLRGPVVRQLGDERRVPLFA